VRRPVRDPASIILLRSETALEEAIYYRANNHFGINVSVGWTGESVSMTMMILIRMF
jgi:hypothetical protein